MSKTALIAMSGGVDSSVAAALMAQRGYDCIGVTMKLRSNNDACCTEKSCCTASDAEDARNAAYSMGMKCLRARAYAESLYRLQPLHEV